MMGELLREMFRPFRSSAVFSAALAFAAVLPSPGASAVDSFALDLGGRQFDPAQGLPAFGDDWGSTAARLAPDGRGLFLVQWSGPVAARWVEELSAAGQQVVRYVHPYSHIVYGDPNRLAALAARERARAVLPFAPAFRLQPRWWSLPSAALEIRVMVVRERGLEATLGELENLGGQLAGHRAIDGTLESVRLTIAGDRLRAIARLPGVYSLRPVPTNGGLRSEMSSQVNVGNVDGTNAAFPGYASWLAATGLDGDGVVIANVDGGVQETHPDLAGRMLPCTGSTCSTTQSSHGTHTAGIMAATGASGTVDSFGFLRGMGVAPGAQLFEQVYSPTYTQAGGMLLLMKQSHANGAVLSGNSWGPSGSPEGYDDDTMQVDIGVRDARDDLAGNQPFNFVLSIMNGDGGTSSQGTPDEAKNIFTIGSTKMQTGAGAQILAIDDLSANSAHGPALDGRKIPHLVAPGCSVDSSVTGSGYGRLCGTSMASPQVSGAVALFVERYRSLTGSDPSPALVKAAFLPVARDLAGHLDADGATLGHRFDSRQGWGRMELAAVVAPEESVAYFDSPAVFQATGESWELAMSVVDSSRPVRVMLVWTDAPGHGLGGSTPAWNNDLDLEVVDGSTTLLGNRFGADGWSEAGGSADDRNNTEGVLLAPAARDAVTLRVLATNLPSDGIPQAGSSTDQDFALVCYNCAASPLIFMDGFESSGTERWSSTAP
jgi:serine protease AprX